MMEGLQQPGEWHAVVPRHGLMRCEVWTIGTRRVEEEQRRVGVLRQHVAEEDLRRRLYRGARYPLGLPCGAGEALGGGPRIGDAEAAEDGGVVGVLPPAACT